MMCVDKILYRVACTLNTFRHCPHLQNIAMFIELPTDRPFVRNIISHNPRAYHPNANVFVCPCLCAQPVRRDILFSFSPNMKRCDRVPSDIVSSFRFSFYLLFLLAFLLMPMLSFYLAIPLGFFFRLPPVRKHFLYYNLFKIHETSKENDCKRACVRMSQEEFELIKE